MFQMHKSHLTGRSGKKWTHMVTNVLAPVSTLCGRAGSICVCGSWKTNLSWEEDSKHVHCDKSWAVFSVRQTWTRREWCFCPAFWWMKRSRSCIEIGSEKSQLLGLWRRQALAYADWTFILLEEEIEAMNIEENEACNRIISVHKVEMKHHQEADIKVTNMNAIKAEKWSNVKHHPSLEHQHQCCSEENWQLSKFTSSRH